MSTLYQFPEIDSGFLDLYNRFAGAGSDFGQYLQPDDPDFQAYLKKTQEPTGSEELLRSYVERRPTYEEYDPSLGRKMASFLIGTLAGVGNPGKGYELAQQHRNAPFKEMMTDWQTEGQNLGTTARMMDAERARELAGMKYGLQTKATAARNLARETFQKEQEARRLAGEVANERRNKELDEERRTQRDVMNTYRSEAAARAKESAANLEAYRAFTQGMTIERDKDRDEAAARKERDLGAINKRLADHASQLGIDTNELTALDIAKQVAMSKAVNYKFFDGLIGKDKRGDYAPNFKGKDPQRVQLLRDWLDKELQKLLRGEGY